jgi:hypothetical protein
VDRHKYSPKPARTSSAKRGDTGSTHVRYAHGLFPRRLEVVCPRCSSLAAATIVSKAPGDRFIETFYRHGAWEIACASCTYRSADTVYEDLPPLFWRVEVAGTDLWAWNRDHLLMLKKLLSREPIESDPYAFLATYARREWLRGSRREALVSAIERVLASPAE